MKILFITGQSRNIVNLNVIYYLEKYISEKTECKWIDLYNLDSLHKQNFNEILSKLFEKETPDWVISNNANLQIYKKVLKDSKEKKFKIAITLADLHDEPNTWINLANQADAILMRYLYSPFVKQKIFGKYSRYKKFDSNYYLNNIKPPILHFPWFTDPNIYVPSNDKLFDVIFLGAYRNKIYPLRNKIVNELPRLSEQKNWKYLVRGRPPGKTLDRDISKLLQQGYIVGEKYSETIAKSKIFIFGNSIFNYPVSKYFEILGSGTLAMVNEPQTSKYLHFIPGKNYVNITDNNWKELLEYYLENEAEREQIARKGYETAMKYHTSEIRSKQLLKFLNQI